jgi:Rrf2 family cysteine metabolism transcriptional repressor
MTLLSRKVDYALLILSYLHHQPAGGSAREIAGRYGLSPGFVANILKLLCRKGFVESHRGVKGGYVLHRPAAEIRLADLMDSLDEAFHLIPCSKTDHTHEPCSVLNICPVRSPLTEVHQRIRELLKNVTLAELFREPTVPGTTQFGLEVGPVLATPIPTR